MEGTHTRSAGRCPVCLSQDVVLPGPAMAPPMLRCRGCGLLWQDGAVTLGPEHYEEDYYDAWGDLQAAREVKLDTFGRYLSVLERHVAVGRLVDVGCAMGYLLEAARGRGWEPWGVEVSRFAGGQARQSFGAQRIHIGTLEDSNLPRGGFSAVCMTDVLEHLPDPVALLRLARDLLRPDGCVLIATPQVGCISQRMMGSGWYQVKEEHTTLFTPVALRTALHAAGFDIVHSSPARKTLTLSYVAHHFRIYRRALITPLLSALERLLGPMARLRLPMPTGEQLVIARRAGADADALRTAGGRAEGGRREPWEPTT